MAEEENNEATEEQTTNETPAKSGSGNKKLLIIGGVVGLVLLIGTPLVIMNLGGEKEEPTAQLEVDAAQEDQKIVLEGFGEEDEMDEEEEALGAIFPMETFVVNLSTGGYLRCQAQIEFESRNIPRRYYTKSVPIRDAIISLMSQQKKEDLVELKARARLKDEIKTVINEILKGEDVRRVYFTQFLIQ
ncbi:MAG: flagellar basal body-associated FliL family protein [Bdellovibrionales bacterium]|nr:flagellar basal body-associated FliL family protein [Bdellovibrionales bacterium]